MLKLENVTRHFGGVKAVDAVSLEVREGSIFGLIGPNGAGKTTLVNLISGHGQPQVGSITLAGERIGGRSPYQVAGMGIARTFQTIRLYRELTALENVLVGMHLRRPDDTLQQLALLPIFRRGQHERVAEARELLARVGLDPVTYGDRKARTLAYGDQRRLEIARALALRPRLLVLDEPAAGMNPAEKQRIRELIETVNAEGLTVLLIDHDMKLVMGVSKHLAVLNFGRKIAEGPPEAVARDPDVVEAYLGHKASKGPAVSQGAAGYPAGGGAAPLLKVEGLFVGYGSIQAARDVSLEVGQGEVVALIGANGAGKSTILNTLSGLKRPQSGTAMFDGLDLTSAPPHRIVSHGLVQVPEGREILAGLTVTENLELGTWSRRDRATAHRQVRELMDRFPILQKRARLPAGQLSGGEQQILAIARGLLASPRLLLLDEPSLGLAPQMVDEVFQTIMQIASEGVTILLVEQNAVRALEVANRAYVLETGRVQLSGRGSDLLRNPDVQRAYLGV